MVRAAIPMDSLSICNIYNYYLLHSTITFEEIPVSAHEMQQRIAEIQSKYSWLVWEEEGNVIGYAYACPWKTRSAYRHSVEISVYVDPAHIGKGIGRQLYTALIKEMQALKMHAVIGGIALPNDTSIRLHESLGFKKIGQFMEVGYKFGKWVNVGYWQLLLENN